MGSATRPRLTGQRGTSERSARFYLVGGSQPALAGGLPQGPLLVPLLPFSKDTLCRFGSADSFVSSFLLKGSITIKKIQS